MLQRTPHNMLFIRLKVRQGLTVNQIYARIHERMSWDGPYPNVSDIELVIRDTGAGSRLQGAASGAMGLAAPDQTKETGR